MSPASTRLARASRTMSHAYRSKRREEALAEAADVEARRARSITTLATAASAMMLGSGGSAARTTRLARQLCEHYGLPAEVDITYTRIVISYEPSVDSDPITVMRMVKPGGFEYDRLTRVENLIERIRTDGMELDTAISRLRHIKAEPRTYRPWVLYAASAVMGGAVALLLGGTAADIAISALATWLVEWARTNLTRRGLNTFFSQAFGAAIPTTIGLAVMSFRPWLPEQLWVVSPSIVIAAGMVSLLAGIGVVTAAGDAIDAYYMSAGSRMVEVLVLTGGIVLGLLFTLWVGWSLGVPAYLAPAEGFTTSPPVQLVSAGLIAAAFGITCNMGPRSVLVAIGMGVLLQSAYLFGDRFLDSPVARAALAAMVVGCVARVLTTRLSIPMVALISTAIAPLMPGLLLYRSVFAMTAQMPSMGQIPMPESSAEALLMRCVLTGAALAVGSSFGASAVGVLLKSLRRGRRRAVAPSAPPAPSLEGPAEPIFTAS